MDTIEIFKTNVGEEQSAGKIVEHLRLHLPFCKINFDLEDCDKILRVQGLEIKPEFIINILQIKGYECELLAD